MLCVECFMERKGANGPPIAQINLNKSGQRPSIRELEPEKDIKPPPPPPTSKRMSVTSLIQVWLFLINLKPKENKCKHCRILILKKVKKLK